MDSRVQRYSASCGRPLIFWLHKLNNHISAANPNRRCLRLRLIRVVPLVSALGIVLLLSASLHGEAQTLNCSGNGCSVMSTGTHTDGAFVFFDFRNSGSQSVTVNFQMSPLGIGGSCAPHNLTVNPHSTNSTTGSICGGAYSASLVLPPVQPVHPIRSVPPGMVPWFAQPIKNFSYMNKPPQIMGEFFSGVGIQDCFPGYGITGVNLAHTSLYCQRVVAFGAEGAVNTIVQKATDGVSKDAAGNTQHMCPANYYLKGYDSKDDWLVCDGPLAFQTQIGTWVATSNFSTTAWVTISDQSGYGGTTVFNGVKRVGQGLQFDAVPYPLYPTTNIYFIGPIPPGFPQTRLTSR